MTCLAAFSVGSVSESNHPQTDTKQLKLGRLSTFKSSVLQEEQYPKATKGL
jgi:hypothetical protein